MEVNPRASMSRAERWSIALRVLLGTLLAAAAAVLATRVLETRKLRVRVDLSSDSANTLDPLTQGVLARLEDDVVVDAYFTPPDPPFQVVGADAQDRTRRLLRLMADESGGRLKVELHDVGERGKPSARAEARRGELQLPAIEPGGLVVVSRGGRKEILRLRGGLADFDAGNADTRLGPYVPARLVSFRAEEALASAFIGLSSSETPLVAIVVGHGGLDPRRDDDFGASSLVRELESDGFRVSLVDLEKGQPLPADTRVVALLSDAQPLSDAAASVVAGFVDAGGRLFVTLGPVSVGPALGGPGSAAELVRRYGIEVLPRGVVARAVPSLGGGMVTGTPACADLSIGVDGMAGQNPITTPLRTAGRRVYLRAPRALKRGTPPAGGAVIEVLRAPEGSWLDLESSDRQHDWQRTAGEEEARFVLAFQAALPALAPVPAERRREGERPETRVFVLGAGEAAANWMVPQNRDFLLLSFNWLAARDTRVALARRDQQSRRLDLSDAEALSGIYFVGVWLAPLLCLAAGLALWWRRRA